MKLAMTCGGKGRSSRRDSQHHFCLECEWIIRILGVCDGRGDWSKGVCKAVGLQFMLLRYEHLHRTDHLKHTRLII